MLITNAHMARSIAYAERAGPEWISLDAIKPMSAIYDGALLTPFHAALSEAPGMKDTPFLIDLGIPGYLLHNDALRIYDLAYRARGDVLELGTHKGLSTFIISTALEDRGGGVLETVDIDGEANTEARHNLCARSGGHRVTFTLLDAADRMDQLATDGRKFGYVFVDHWHGYDVTRAACERLPAILSDGAFVQFHDFADVGNIEADHPYGVYQAVLDTVCEDPRFMFVCLSGCTAVFRFNCN